MPMIWDYAEANPFSSASGSFLNSLYRTCESIAMLPAGISSNTVIHDAVAANSIHDAILCTELPYYDKASYADLSDFFYVWMKYGLEDIFPDYFKTEITSKKEELTAFPYRWNGDKKQANAFYAEGLCLAMKNLYESVTDEYPSSISFFYKGNDVQQDGSLSEWETFITAVRKAGFVITASWPLGRKYENSIEIAEERGIPITVIVRKRSTSGLITTRRNFVAAVKRELPGIVNDLSSKVSLMDLRASIIGQALYIYTRYGNILDADGNFMPSFMASRIIEQEIDALLTPIYQAEEQIQEVKE